MGESCRPDKKSFEIMKLIPNFNGKVSGLIRRGGLPPRQKLYLKIVNY